MNPEAHEQYLKALKAGQKYYKAAVSRGEYPYPPVLDDILTPDALAGYVDLGLTNIPADRIVGTKSAGRSAALAGNFMPLLGADSEFAGKWMHLCDAHLGDEGIRDPIRCFEYFGRFYVAEGNKRASVLKSYEAPTIPALVTRAVPRWSEAADVQLYYEFMAFYALSGLYGVDFRRPGSYARLQAALGVEPDHVWTEEERRSFRAGFSRFEDAVRRLHPGETDVTAAEALLVWLQVYGFTELKALPLPELTKKLGSIWPDVLASADDDAIDLNTVPADKDRSLLSKIRGVVHADHLRVAFLYTLPPEISAWTRAHDEGRAALAESLGTQVDIRTYLAADRDYAAAIDKAADDGAELLFATTPDMLAACRRAAVRYPKLRFLTCGLSQPYTGVRMYYSRLYECKFITGAIAGAMAENGLLGYVANYPIVGLPASVNAFALGARLTNPRARVLVAWSCVPGDPVKELIDRGATVISNREAESPQNVRRSFEIGTYKLLEGGSLQPLAAPLWNWGRMYERIVGSVFSGVWDDIAKSRAVNYWWGMDSGVIDVRFAPDLPDGMRTLGEILKDGILRGSLDPFRTRILDQDGVLRNDGERGFTPEELMTMDWFCQNVEGRIPAFDELRPVSRELVRVLGLYRDELPPETEAKQL